MANSGTTNDGQALTSLQRLREAAGLTREGLGARAGLTARGIYSIEVKGVQPRRTTVAALARALGVEPEAIAEL